MSTAALPHAYPFRFVDTILQEPDAAFAGGRVRARISANGRGSMGGGWRSPLLLAELIAQAALLLERGDPEAGRNGYLAGLDALEMTRAPEAGETLEVEVRLTGSFGPVFRFDGRVRSGDEVLATGGVLVKKGRPE
jgi:hypothetical protein